MSENAPSTWDELRRLSENELGGLVASLVDDTTAAERPVRDVGLDVTLNTGVRIYKREVSAHDRVFHYDQDAKRDVRTSCAPRLIDEATYEWGRAHEGDGPCAYLKVKLIIDPGRVYAAGVERTPAVRLLLHAHLTCGGPEPITAGLVSVRPNEDVVKARERVARHLERVWDRRPRWCSKKRRKKNVT